MMIEKKQNFTRAEVENLLEEQEVQFQTILNDHYEPKRGDSPPPLWVTITAIAMGVVSLWALAIWAF